MTSDPDRSDSPLLTTAEVAAFLRVKERKVYELVADEAIPCTRVTGKLLFPRTLIELWLAAGTRGGTVSERRTPPPIAAGSHDPLLDWALKESGAGIATLFDGSLDGVERFARGEALFAGLHVPDPEAEDVGGGAPNRAIVAGLSGMAGGLVLIEWARRTQGLMLAPGNPKKIAGIADLAAGKVLFQPRQPSAGSHILLEQLLKHRGLDFTGLATTGTVARDETQAAEAVSDGRADAAVGIAAAADRAGLDFLPLAVERYDIVISRHDYFGDPFQALLAVARSRLFAEEAARLTGYDVSGTGRVSYNAP